MSTTKIKKEPMAFEVAMDIVHSHLLRRKGEWREIAERAGVTYRWIISFAKREYGPVKIENLLKLAAALGLKIRLTVEATARTGR